MAEEITDSQLLEVLSDLSIFRDEEVEKFLRKATCTTRLMIERRGELRELAMNLSQQRIKAHKAEKALLSLEMARQLSDTREQVLRVDLLQIGAIFDRGDRSLALEKLKHLSREGMVACSPELSSDYKQLLRRVMGPDGGE